MIGKFSINTCLGANISSLQQPDIDQVQLTKTSSQQDETGKNTVINSRSLAVNEIKYSRSFFPQGTQLLFTPQTAVDTTLKNLQ